MNRTEALERIDWTRTDGAAHIRGFNYQPTWGRNGVEVWWNFDPDRYRRELERGRELFPPFNTVRIWLSWSAWKLDPKRIARNVEQAISICADVGLLVMPCLFTRWRGIPEYDPVSYADFNGVDFEASFGPFIDAVVKPHAGNDAVLAWDLCNEAIQAERHQKGWHEGYLDIDEILAKQRVWLDRIRERVARLAPDAKTCLGHMRFWHTQEVQDHFESLVDLLTPHPYEQLSWEIDGKTGTKEEHYDALIAEYINDVRARGVNKPIVANECCWGSLDDAARAENVRVTLSVLTKHGVGILPHALWCSPVADLHPPELGPVAGPGYMGFINADGSLRAGHEIYNEILPR